jgi:hypothetical protein
MNNMKTKEIDFRKMHFCLELKTKDDIPENFQFINSLSVSVNGVNILCVWDGSDGSVQKNSRINPGSTNSLFYHFYDVKCRKDGKWKEANEIIDEDSKIIVTQDSIHWSNCEMEKFNYDVSYFSVYKYNKEINRHTKIVCIDEDW